MERDINRFIKYALPLLIAVSGCNKSFIERSDPTRVNTADYINNQSSLDGAVTATYGTLQPIYNGGAAGFQLFGEVASDNSTTQTGGIGAHVLDRFIFDPSFSAFSQFWNLSYKSIAQANIVISRAPGIAMDQVLQKRYIAEARFIRALGYFNLVRIFGDVPLVTAEIKDYKDAYNFGRTPVNEVYSQVIQDLQAAATDLPANYTGADIGRTTSGAAKALLGKVYLTRNKYPEAAAILTEVINSGAYSLLADYNSVFSTTNEMNNEIIFAVRYMRGGLGLGSGFGGAMIPANSGTDILKTGATNGSYNAEMPDLANAFSSQDKRKSISVGYYAAGQPTSYYSSKFIDQQTTTPVDAENDWIVLRYADVLLMQAEALNELNRTGEAVTLINQVRQRAGLADTTGLDQPGFRLAVENERRLELSMEGHRWFDLVRTGRALTVMNNHFTANAVFYGATYTLKPYQLLFPIPLSEIQTNPKLTQNQGY